MIFLILGLVCAGCVNKNGQMLSLAAGCMEVAPDSAMSILEKVENIREESHSQQAFFALLWIQARHKCHLPLGNDSLINIATNFYTQNKENHLAAKALLYKGLVHKQRKEVEKAAEAFALSEQWFEGVEDNQYKALLYNHYGMLMYDQANYEDALIYLKRSHGFKLKGDSIHYVVSACEVIANTFELIGEMDSAKAYFEKGLQYEEKVSQYRYSSFKQNYANFLRKNGEYAKAEQMLLECELLLTGKQRYSVYSSLATLYYDTKDYAKALTYAEKMKESTDSLMMRGYYLHLYRIHTQLGNKDKAHECYKQYTDIHDAIQERLKTKEVAVIPYQVEKQMLTEKLETGQMLREWLIVIIAALTVIALIIYRVQRSKYKRKQKEMQQKLTEKSVKIGNLKSIVSNKDNKIERIETEKEVQTERISNLEKDVKRLRDEGQETLQAERNLKEELKLQYQKQEVLKDRIMVLEKEQQMRRLQECCERHPEKEKMMELLGLLKGSELCSLKNSECIRLITALTDMMYPEFSNRIACQVQNEKKRIICNLIALGVDDVAIIKKMVILNEKTIKKYHRECQLLMETTSGDIGQGGL